MKQFYQRIGMAAITAVISLILIGYGGLYVSYEVHFMTLKTPDFIPPPPDIPGQDGFAPVDIPPQKIPTPEREWISDFQMVVEATFGGVILTDNGTYFSNYDRTVPRTGSPPCPT